MIVQDIKYRTRTHTRVTSRNPRIESTQSETSRRITLTGKAYEAVNNDFNEMQPPLRTWGDVLYGTSDQAPITPDEFSSATRVGETLIEIQESLERFREDYTDSATTTFILTQFGETPAHEEIVDRIRAGLSEHAITGVRADDREYHDDLFSNVLTHLPARVRARHNCV